MLLVVVPETCQPPYADSFRAARNTSSSISSVSFPVDVFCWLG
jgi:hypothetical protein